MNVDFPHEVEGVGSEEGGRLTAWEKEVETIMEVINWTCDIVKDDHDWILEFSVAIHEETLFSKK